MAIERLKMVYCTQCRGEISQGAAYCQHCGTFQTDIHTNIDPALQPPQRGDGFRKALKWTGIGCGGFVGLVVVIILLAFIATALQDDTEEAESALPTSSTQSPALALDRNSPTPPPSEIKKTPLPEAPSQTSRDVFIAGGKVGDALMSQGWKFDDAFVQEVVTVVETEVPRESGEWTVLNSDIVVICDIYQRIGEARQSGNDVNADEFNDILHELGPKRSALMGATLAGVRDDSGAIVEYCAPIGAYNVGFVAALEGTAGFYEGNLSDELIATQSAAAIDKVSRGDLRKAGKEATYSQGFLAGADAANEVFGKDSPGGTGDSDKVSASERGAAVRATGASSPDNQQETLWGWYLADR